MNFKERGITVGDLLVIIILVISTVLIINKINESDSKTVFNVSAIEIPN